MVIHGIKDQKEGKQAETYKKSIEKLDRLFSTEDVTDNEGKKKPWLDYHFKGFPIIASYTKLTAMQSDIKATETNLFNNFLGNVMVDAVSLNKYKAIVLADKSAFFLPRKKIWLFSAFSVQAENRYPC